MIITYTGTADVRVISSSDFTTHGLSSPTLEWRKSNGFSLDVPPDIAAFLLAQGDFVADSGAVFGDVVEGIIQPADFGILYRVPTVKYYGAIGDGVANDTAAVQAAINAHREVIFPEGKYKCGQLNARMGSRLLGETHSFRPSDPLVQIDSTVIGLSGTPAALWIAAGSVDTDSGVTVENMWIKGHASETVDYTASGFPSWGIRGGSQIADFRLINSIISGFNVNVALYDARNALIDHSILMNAVDCNLQLVGICNHVTARQSEFIVVNEVGSANANVQIANVWIYKYNDAQYSSFITFMDMVMDEVARNGQVAAPVTLKVDKCDNLVVERVNLYYPVGATGGNGVGIDLAAGTRNVLRDITVRPYVANSTHVPINTIKIGAGVTRSILDGVFTDPNTASGGVDISDLSTDTEYRRVNGESRPILKAPNGTRYRQTMDNAGLPVYTAIA